MPQKNCGICGYGSCNTFARHILFGKGNIKKCAWLDEEELELIRSATKDVTPLKTRSEGLAVFEPCLTDSQMVMAEIHLASREVNYGYVDPGFCEILPLYFSSVKCSQILGIARIEFEDKEILVSQTGKTIVRHAENEKDALKMCDLLSRSISASVICPCLATAAECISGLCTCEACEILENSSLSPDEKDVIKEKEYNSVLAALSHMWEGESSEMEDLLPLKVKAAALLAQDKGGLILYTLVHHLSLMQSAIKDAVCYPIERRNQKEITQFVKDACTDFYIPEDFQKIHLHLIDNVENPFLRELHKVVFHAKCIAEIRNRFFR